MQGKGVRIGIFPAKFDEEREKLTWYWFMGCAAMENVRAPIACWPYSIFQPSYVLASCPC